MTRLLSQGEIEEHIIALSDELETATDLYADQNEDAAEAEHAYKLKVAQRLVRLADTNTRMTAATRQAMADLEAESEHRAYLVTKARQGATKEKMLSLRHRIDALRTLAANVRYQTETRR
jgi:hypothetical protein